MPTLSNNTAANKQTTSKANERLNRDVYLLGSLKLSTCEHHNRCIYTTYAMNEINNRCCYYYDLMLLTHHIPSSSELSESSFTSSSYFNSSAVIDADADADADADD